MMGHKNCLIFGGINMEVACKGSVHAKPMGIVCLVGLATLRKFMIIMFINI